MSVGIADDRCSGNDGGELQIVLQGGSFDYDGQTLVANIFFHVSYSCFEVVVFEPAASQPWMRLYFLNKVIQPKIDSEAFNKAVEEQKEVALKLRRHYSIDIIYRNASFVVLQKLILSCLPDLINFEISRRFVKDQAETSEILVDLLGRRLEYRSYYADRIELACPKPECLVPVNLDPSQREQTRILHQRSEKTRAHVTGLIQGFRNFWSQRLQVIDRQLNLRRSSVSFPEKGTSVAQLLSGEVRPKPSVQVDQPIVRPLERQQSAFLMLSALRRRASGYFSSFTNDSDEPTQTQESGPGTLLVTAPRFQWIRAIDRVLTRNVHAKVVKRLEEVQEHTMTTSLDSSPVTISEESARDSVSSKSQSQESIARARTRVIAASRFSLGKAATESPDGPQTPAPRKRMSLVMPASAAAALSNALPSANGRRHSSAATPSTPLVPSSRPKVKELQQAQGGWKLNRSPLLATSGGTVAADNVSSS